MHPSKDLIIPKMFYMIHILDDIPGYYEFLLFLLKSHHGRYLKFLLCKINNSSAIFKCRFYQQGTFAPCDLRASTLYSRDRFLRILKTFQEPCHFVMKVHVN